MLRAAPAGDLRNVISAAVDVAVSVNPDRAIFAVDAGLEALETASAGDLLNLVKAAEHATSAAITNGQLIPSDEEIDKVVDAAAVVGIAAIAAHSASCARLGMQAGVPLRSRTQRKCEEFL